METCVVVRNCVQVGPEDWEMKTTTRIFAGGNTIDDILRWVESLGIKNPTCNDFVLTDHKGST